MAKIHITTQGCSANLAESEVMAGILESDSHKVVESKEDAEVILLNVCTVKGPKTALNEIKESLKKHPNKKMVVSGCISKELRPMIKELNQDISMISTNNMVEIKSAMKSTIENKQVELFNKLKDEKINFPRVRTNPLVGIIPISQGCNQACAYCTVVLVKGALQSYTQEKIVNEVKQAVVDGCKEIWLTSQDTASYRLEEKENSKLHLLLQDLCKIEGDFKIRVGMMNPTFVDPVLDKIIESFKHPKIYKFLHLPVQAGSNRILDLMERGYHVEDYIRIVEAFRKEIPEITIATDVIVGLPSETEEEFEETLKVIEKTKPIVCNISRFVARPYTRAYYMKDQVHGKFAKDWSRRTTKLFNAITHKEKQKWLGWEGVVMVTLDAKPESETMEARNHCYTPVVVPGKHKLGTKLKVKIVEAHTHHLIAEILNK